MNNIHHTALIEEGVKLGDNNIIEPYVIIRKGTILGNGNIIKSFSVIGSSPSVSSNLKEKTLLIGNNNIFYYNTQIQLGTYNVTNIGDSNILHSNVTIGHDTKIGNNNLLCSYTGLASNVVIDNNCTLYSYVKVFNNIMIGKNSIISADSLVKGTVLPYSLVDGRPSRTIKLNIKNKKVYNIIFKSKLSRDKIIEKLYELDNDKQINDIIFYLKYVGGRLCK